MLGYDYAAKQAFIDDPPSGEPSPHVYVLCTHCAERLKAPRGWDLIDRRTEPPLFLDERSSAITVLEAATPEDRTLENQRRQLFFGTSA